MVARILGAMALMLAMTVAAAAASSVFATPEALLTYAYAPYSTGDFKDDNDLLYSQDLLALFASAEANTPEDDIGPIDFDVFVNGQDYQLTDLTIGAEVPEGQGVDVPVALKNFGDQQSLVFHFIREGAGWKINDIESLTPGASWRLTTLLQSVPDGAGPDGSAVPDGGDPSAPIAPPADEPAVPAGE